MKGVVAAASGHEALDVLARQLEHIDVLLTDVIMPHMQGKELADKIRILQFSETTLLTKLREILTTHS